MEKELKKNYILEHLEEALQQNRIKVYYQPIVRVLTKELCDWEALARWEKEDGTLIMPGDFIPVLEEANLIHRLDLYVVEQVCKDYRDYVKTVNDMVQPISINLSRLDFTLCDIFQEINTILAKYQMPHYLIDIEITETALILDEALLRDYLKKFRSEGYRVWLDDFGSGYSSFNVMKDFDFDLLKIDMEFLKTFESNPKSKDIISTIIDLAKRLGLQTVAEGVTTEAQYDFLREIGCEKAQGYYIGKPEPGKMAVQNLLIHHIHHEEYGHRNYMDAISGLNLMSDYPIRRTGADVEFTMNVSGQPLAVLEYRDGLVHHLSVNRSYMRSIYALGLRSIEEAENYFNMGQWKEKQQAIQIAAQCRADGSEHRLDFIARGMIFTMKICHIATDNERHSSAYTLMLFNQSSMITQDGRCLDTALHFLYATYDRIDLLQLNEDHVENIYMNATRYREKFQEDSIIESAENYAKKNVYSADQQRFLEFYDISTFRQRVLEGNGRFLWECFRTITNEGQYQWQNYILIPIELNGQEMVLSCVNDCIQHAEELLDQMYNEERKGQVNKITPGVMESTVEDTEESLYASREVSTFNILNNVLELMDAGVFWKDKNRRFLGANRKFLEYYGFESVESILGKTDEEVGWHIDPDQFVNDEEVVIKKGKTIEKSPGQCIVQGEVREIEATKRPLFKDGKIVGLIGFFEDVTEQKQEWNREDDDRLIMDSIDDVSTSRAFYGVLSKYEDAYWSKGLDFALIFVELRDLGIYKISYGESFVTKLLRRMVRILRREIGENCVLIRKNANEFLILHQYKQRMEIMELESRIKEALKAIHQIENIPVDLEMLFGVGFYSETEDPKRMLKIVDARKNGISDYYS